MEELSDYRRENYPIFSQMSIEEIAKVIKFVDRKFKEIANLLRKEKQTRKISFFHRVRPCAMQELYELMRLIVDKSPITYYEAPAPSSSPPIYENGYM